MSEDHQVRHKRKVTKLRQFCYKYVRAKHPKVWNRLRRKAGIDTNPKWVAKH